MIKNFSNNDVNNRNNYEIFELNHLLDKTLESFDQIGNLNFFITINFKNDLTFNDNNINNKIEKKIKQLINLINKKIELWSFMSINIEENKQKKIHFHCILGIRSILGYNPTIFNNIKNILRDNFEIDSYVYECKDLLDSKIKIHYCYKDVKKYHNYNSFFFIENWQQNCAELLDYFDNNNLLIKQECFRQKEKLDTLQGLKKINNEIDKNIILNLWNYYLVLNNYYIYNNNIYIKDENYTISYKKICDISFLYNNLTNSIIPFFIKNFPLQFKDYQFYQILSKFISHKNQLIDTLNLITTNKFKPNFDLLEFKDGIYSVKINKFIPKNIIKEYNLENKIFTIKSYNKTYKHLGKPTKWINNIEKTLNKNEEDIKNLYLFIANIFHQNKRIFIKRRVLFIIGDSNTQKTTLIGNPLQKYFGEENIGKITTGDNFNFQDIDSNKILVIMDEYQHSENKKTQGLFLKWFEGDSITIERKHKNPEIIENKPTILISNNDISVKDDKIKEAFNNRFIKLFFQNKIEHDKVDRTITDELEKEEASIIIHCNKIYFKNVLKKDRTRVDYIKTLKLLEFDQEKINKDN